jgi:hypothetical protein
MCEHNNKSRYVAGEEDETSPMLYDFSDGNSEQIKSNYEETTNPDKHPTVTKAGYSA